MGEWGFGTGIGDIGSRLQNELGYQTLVCYAYRNCGWKLEIRNLRLCMRHGSGIVNIYIWARA